MKTYFSEFGFDPGVRALLKLPAERRYGEVVERNKHLRASDRHQYVSNVTAHFAQLTMLSGTGTDYFIETNDLVDTLLSFARDFPKDLLLSLFDDIPFDALVIHPPSPRPAVLLGSFTDPVGDRGVGFFGNNFRCRSRIVCFTTQAEFPLEGYKDSLAIGLAIYSKYFPEGVRDGLPEIAKHPNHYKGSKCIGVRMSESLIDRSGPVPHIRKCYWKVLHSPFYTHKRGQAVFVREAMVNGKCKVVCEVKP